MLPNARQQPEEEEEAIALGERRQEGKDTVYSQCHNETAPTANFVCQTPPQERAHHHAEKHHQTCTDRQTHRRCSDLVSTRVLSVLGGRLGTHTGVNTSKMQQGCIGI